MPTHKAGATWKQITSVGGWENLQDVQIYIEKAEQKRLAERAISKFEREQKWYRSALTFAWSALAFILSVITQHFAEGVVTPTGFEEVTLRLINQNQT